MHTGEEWFVLQWQHYVVLGVLLASYMVLAFSDRLPRMQAFKDFLDAVNSAGGHIFLLTLLSVWSVRIEMQYIYHVIALPGEVLEKRDAIIMVGLSAVQAGLAGTFIGALLKTMSGGKANGTPPAVPDKLDVGFVSAKDLNAKG